MKKLFLTVIAFLLVSTVGLTILWSGESLKIAQSKHMDQGMHGAKKSHGHSMGEMKHGMKMKMASEGAFEGVGVVIALVPEKSQIVVDHEEIPGFMSAMTMGYPVKPSKLLRELKQGDKIRFTIDAKEKAIVKITRIGHAAHEGQMHKRPMGGMEMKGMEGHKHHDHQEHHKQMDVPSKMPPRSTLKPAEGASVQILSPQNGHAVTGSEVNIRFRLTKGKRGNHVHAYVDAELMGMFSADDESQNGQGSVVDIQPGHHTLELRVVTADHNTELDATDSVKFMVK